MKIERKKVLFGILIELYAILPWINSNNKDWWTSKTHSQTSLDGMRFIFTSVKHPNQYTCLLEGFLSPIDPVSSRVDSRLWSWISTECVPMTVLGLSSAIPPHLFLLLRLAFVRTYPRILECERHDCFGKHNLPGRSNLFDARWYFLASSCDLLPSQCWVLEESGAWLHGWAPNLCRVRFRCLYCWAESSRWPRKGSYITESVQEDQQIARQMGFESPAGVSDGTCE